MATKKQALKKRTPEVLPKLTETERDLLWHLEHERLVYNHTSDPA